MSIATGPKGSEAIPEETGHGGDAGNGSAPVGITFAKLRKMAAVYGAPEDATLPVLVRMPDGSLAKVIRVDPVASGWSPSHFEIILESSRE